MKQPLLVVVEGVHDAQFLVRVCDRLRIDIHDLPDLRRWVIDGTLLLVPVGGGDAASWPDRFRSLGHREFHLYDREQMPETNVRQRAIDRVNGRFGCHGALTSKRAVENYLHPLAIAAAGDEPSFELSFGDHDPVCLLVARRWCRRTPTSAPWEYLATRTRRRMTARAKRWLNTAAVDCMTAGMLAERDPSGEVLGWLRAIQELAQVGSFVG